jgi:hypothetical protein
VFHAGKDKATFPDKYRAFQDFLPAEFLHQAGLDALIPAPEIEAPPPLQVAEPPAENWAVPLLALYGPVQTGVTPCPPERALAGVLSQLQIEMPKATYDTWLWDLRLVGFHDGTLYLAAPNELSRQWVDGRLNSTLERMFTGLLNCSIRIQIVSPEGTT